MRPSYPPPSYEESAPTSLYDDVVVVQESARRVSATVRTEDSSSTTSTPKLSTDSSIPPSSAVSALHPQVAVILGVKKRWHIPLQLCRCFSMYPAISWAVTCLWVFAESVFLFENGKNGRRLHLPAPGPWDLSRRIAATEVILATVWCAASAYLSFLFADCLMSRWLLNYDPAAVIVRLSVISMIISIIANQLMHFCNIELEPARLLPAWIFITVTLTLLYHFTQRNTNIRRETSAARRAFWLAMEITLFVFLVQLHFPSHLLGGRLKPLELHVSKGAQDAFVLFSKILNVCGLL